MITKLSVLLFLIVASCACAQSASDPESIRVPDGVPTLSTSHTLSIDRVLLSPDGRRVFTHDGGNVYAWDFESRKKLRPLSATASSQKGTALSEFHFITDQKRLVFGSNSVNYETLEPFPSWPDVRFEASAWDSKRQKRFWSRGSREEIQFGELVDRSPAARASRAHVIIKSKEVQQHRAACHSLTVLDDGRLLASTTHGIFFIDPDTWTISSPGREPERGVRTLMYMDDTRDVKTATFTHEAPSGSYVNGPQGTLIRSKASSIAENRTEISIVSAKDLTVLRTTVMQGFPTYLGAGTFDPEKKQLWFKTRQSLVAIDFDTLVPRDSISVEKLAKDQFAFVGDAVPVPGSTHWLIAIGKTLWLYDVATESTLGSFGEAASVFNRIATHPTRFEFLVTDQRDSTKRVRFLPSGIEVSTIKGTFASFAFDPTDGETIAHGNSGAAIIYFSDRQNWPKQDFRLPERGAPSTHGAPQHLLYSADGTRIAAHSHYGVTAYDLTSGKVILNQPGSQKWIPPERQITAFSPDNKWLVAYDGEKKIIGYDCERGQKIWEQSVDQYPRLIYFAGPKTVCTLVNGQFEYRSVETGVVKLSAPLVGAGSSRCATVSPDRKLIAWGGHNLVVYDPDTESVVFETKTSGHIGAVAFFSHSPRYLITAGADNLLRIWDLQEKQELCSIALFDESNDWVVTTKNLRFDGSEKAIDKMYVVKGTDVIPLESLFDQLYTPKLLASLLRGEKLETPAIDLKKLVAPPIVRLEFADGTRNLVVEDDTPGVERSHDALRLRALADARQSTVAEIRLFQNGKLLTSAQGRGAAFVENFDVKLVPGENVFRAVALNADHTESRPAELTLTYRPKATAAIAGAPAQQPTGLQLHLLIVGVNTYKNPKYNLNYAVADATAVKERLEAQTKSIFTAINVTFILNDNADKASLTSAFKSISTQAGPRDVFVFYYAGHGVMTSDARPEFFLVPHDVTQLYGADDALRQKGLSSGELLELSKLMPAQKQLYILDACQSAGALTTVAMRGAAEEKAIAQLARSSGTHWLTASGSEQFATEFAQLGHGAFTYALIEGLAGKADTGDGRVTVNELKAWLETQVPELTQKHKGTPQYPSSYGFGQDFPVAVVK